LPIERIGDTQTADPTAANCHFERRVSHYETPVARRSCIGTVVSAPRLSHCWHDKTRIKQCENREDTMSASVRSLLALALALILLPPLAKPIQAQTYPDHVVKIIVPFPAGGTADAVPRIVADWLSRKWGQTVVIENRPGAAG